MHLRKTIYSLDTIFKCIFTYYTNAFREYFLRHYLFMLWFNHSIRVFFFFYSGKQFYLSKLSILFMKKMYVVSRIASKFIKIVLKTHL